MAFEPVVITDFIEEAALVQGVEQAEARAFVESGARNDVAQTVPRRLTERTPERAMHAPAISPCSARGWKSSPVTPYPRKARYHPLYRFCNPKRAGLTGVKATACFRG